MAKDNAVEAAKALTPKQSRFVEEYVIDFNGTRAAIEAGYSQKTARQQALENLTKPDIQAAIEKQAKKLTAAAHMSALDVVTGLVRIASQNAMDFFDLSVAGQPRIDLSKLTREQAYPIQSIKTKSYRMEHDDSDDAEIVTETELKFEPKIQALTTLAKYHGLLLGKRGGAGDDLEDVDLMEVDEEELLEEIILRRTTTTRKSRK